MAIVQPVEGGSPGLCAAGGGCGPVLIRADILTRCSAKTLLRHVHPRDDVQHQFPNRVRVRDRPLCRVIVAHAAQDLGQCRTMPHWSSDGSCDSIC